jgi:glycosyltransferase involved in cell wall biosynthesis
MHAQSGFLPLREDSVRTLANPHGVFESLPVRECNEALLAALTPPEQLLLPGQHWLSRLDPGVHYSACDEVRTAVRERLARPGCLKDSRFVWTLPTWLDEAPDSPIVCVFRSPEATAKSILAACQHEPSADRPALDLADAYEIWIASYERILDHLSRRGNWHFIHVDQTFCSAGLDALEEFTGHKLNRNVPIPELRSKNTCDEAPVRAKALYAELCQLANFIPDEDVQRPTANRSQAPDVALVIPILESHRPHLPRLLDELSSQRNVNAQVVLIDQTTDGGIATDQALVIRESNPGRGVAYKRALDATTAPFIAWQDPAVTLFPHRLARQLAALQDHPQAALCTSQIAVRDRQGRITRQAAVDLAGCTPPAYWESGVLLRRSALAGISMATFAPAELELFNRLSHANQTMHLAEPLCSILANDLEDRDAWVRQDSDLVRLAERPRSGHPKISVLMASHNRKEALTECLEALSRQLLPPGTFEVIVIDDGSKDGTQELFRDMALPIDFRFIEQENTGAASARNRGLPFVRSELVLFINDDTILFPNTVRGHIEAHRELKDQRAIVLGTFEQPQAECEKTLTRLLEASTLVFGYFAFEDGADVGGVNFYTCNLSLPTHAIRNAGAFDEKFPMFGEDTDYGFRLEDMGYRIFYRDELRATHRHVLPFEAIERRQVAVSTAQIRLYQKHPRAMPKHHLDRTVAIMRKRRDMTLEFAESTKRVLRNLGSIRVALLEQDGSGATDSAEKITAWYVANFLKINLLLWEAGFTAELTRRDLAGFAELLSEPALPSVDSMQAPLPSHRIERAPLGTTRGTSHAN